MRIFKKRDKTTLVDCTGYVDLPSACVRANKDGYFGLSQRVAPESFDGKNTNIDPRECFFGGRRIELALQAKNAEDFATRSSDTSKVGTTTEPAGPGSDKQE